MDEHLVIELLFSMVVELSDSDKAIIIAGEVLLYQLVHAI